MKKTTQLHDQIMNIKVDSTPRDILLTQISEKLTKKVKFSIVTPNPEIILEAQSDSELASSLNSADFSIPDGNGLKIAIKNLQIIKGREFMLDLFNLGNNNKLKVYLLGSTNEVIKKSLVKINKEYKDINAKGNSGPWLDNSANPISEKDINLNNEVIKEINSFNPHLLFVAFGAPKQEKWISKNIDNLKVIGIMAVGGSLDYYSGVVKSVPKLFVNLKLEWLWRLIQEPYRLKRVFNALILFPVKLFLQN